MHSAALKMEKSTIINLCARGLKLTFIEIFSLLSSVGAPLGPRRVQKFFQKTLILAFQG